MARRCHGLAAIVCCETVAFVRPLDAGHVQKASVLGPAACRAEFIQSIRLSLWHFRPMVGEPRCCYRGLTARKSHEMEALGHLPSNVASLRSALSKRAESWRSICGTNQTVSVPYQESEIEAARRPRQPP